jgi:dTDP-4-amino-4,6-dideoxygalactose transaminase
MTKIPLLDLKAHYSTIRLEIREAIDRVVESQRFILRPEVEGLKQQITTFCKVRFAVCASSRTDALLAALW